MPFGSLAADCERCRHRVIGSGLNVSYATLSLTLIVVLTFFRLAYVFFWCAYDLAPDEAHYWDWSRHPDWSYYSKGPLVAWLIRAGVFLFGDLSEAWTGNLTAAVRTPAVLCGALFLVGLRRLATGVFQSERMGFCCVGIAALAPSVNAFSIIMTIDAPFLTCWVWASVFGFEALRDDARGKWLLTGLIVAVGILAKYTMAIWWGSFVLFLLVNPRRRSLLISADFWLMTFVATLSALPILIWNSQHDWVTFRHVAGQAGVSSTTSGASGIRWLGPVLFLLGQAGIHLGYWFVLGVWSMWRNRPGQARDDRMEYLWWLSVPTLVFFAAISLRTSVQLNWPAAAYVGGLLLAADFLRRIPGLWTDPIRRHARRTLLIFLSLGLAVSVLIHETRGLTRLISPMLPPDTPEKPTRIRQFDPAARLRGWSEFAARIDAIRSEIRQSGQADPVLTALRWDLPGEMGFYCEGHPPVYSLGLAMGDRHSQYDWWRPNPLADAQDFLGRTFVFVGVPGVGFALEGAFDTVDEPLVITHREGDRAAAEWHVWICRGFRGFGDRAMPGSEARH